ncbi:TetR/AcrR family transcriptional regulator [Paracoccus suum]|uniref:TetR/AcrR family transcriptional regulator n=1 Tax=Paracoccus suum TaxID=2259340 RepID=A0A344PL66_9RHOB|nr:TetR/AcrR family transcriptional regulator [Paracoccus suum]AXC50121.1 TetR/AcrR family transcriptional regulator [Paracoccus suum]
MARTHGSRAGTTGPLIRAAALRLFARHGYDGVSMRQIAAEVGLQAGALYGHVPDKQALLFGLLSDHMTALLAAWQDDPAAAPLTRLEAFVRFHVRLSLEHADGVFLSMIELRSLTPENLARITAQRRSYEDALQVILDAGRADGTMHVTEPRLTAMALIAMLTGVTSWYRAGGRLDRERIEALYWGLVRGAVTGGDRA